MAEVYGACAAALRPGGFLFSAIVSAKVRSPVRIAMTRDRSGSGIGSVRKPVSRSSSPYGASLCGLSRRRPPSVRGALDGDPDP